MSEIPSNAPKPRFCLIVKWPDFDGYGFNLHADKSRPGQYIGKVDENSPADVAGLKEGDRIIEVNGVNISNENHKQVVQRIKEISNETRLLVVDGETDRWYKEHNIVVSSDQPNIAYGTSQKTHKEEEPASNGQVKKGEDDAHSLASAQSSHSETSTQPQLANAVEQPADEALAASAEEKPLAAAEFDDECGKADSLSSDAEQGTEAEKPKGASETTDAEEPTTFSEVNTEEQASSSDSDVVQTYDNVVFEQEKEHQIVTDEGKNKEDVEELIDNIIKEPERLSMSSSTSSNKVPDESVADAPCHENQDVSSLQNEDASSPENKDESSHENHDASSHENQDISKEEDSEEERKSPMSITPSPPPSIEPEAPSQKEKVPEEPNRTSSSSTAMKNGGLNLNMTAAEMRAQLAAKKKFDPRKDPIDLKKKYQIIQNM